MGDNDKSQASMTQPIRSRALVRLASVNTRLAFTHAHTSDSAMRFGGMPERNEVETLRGGIMLLTLLRTVLCVASLLAAGSAIAEDSVTLTHVHGLAYSPDGKRLMVPSHHGLAVYESGQWSKAPGPEHDYMGFSTTANYVYSSGHPAPGSGLVNPFGLLCSRDGGKTWQKLGLE